MNLTLEAQIADALERLTEDEEGRIGVGDRSVIVQRTGARKAMAWVVMPPPAARTVLEREGFEHQEAIDGWRLEAGGLLRGGRERVAAALAAVLREGFGVAATTVLDVRVAALDDEPARAGD